MTQFKVGDKFTWIGQTGLKSETVTITRVNGSIGFESAFTPGMTLPVLKVIDLMHKNRLIKL